MCVHVRRFSSVKLLCALGRLHCDTCLVLVDCAHPSFTHVIRCATNVCALLFLPPAVRRPIVAPYITEPFGMTQLYWFVPGRNCSGLFLHRCTSASFLAYTTNSLLSACGRFCTVARLCLLPLAAIHVFAFAFACLCSDTSFAVLLVRALLHALRRALFQTCLATCAAWKLFSVPLAAGCVPLCGANTSAGARADSLGSGKDTMAHINNNKATTGPYVQS